MRKFLTRIARRIEPDFAAQSQDEQLALLGNLFGCLYALPFLLLSLGWLLAISDWSLLRDQLPLVIVFFVLAAGLNQIDFFQMVKTESGSYSTNSSNLSGVILTSAYLCWARSGSGSKS